MISHAYVIVRVLVSMCSCYYLSLLLRYLKFVCYPAVCAGTFNLHNIP